eukprot:scaffold73279_cov18-Tisochrysis_lutea.AAC.5
MGSICSNWLDSSSPALLVQHTQSSIWLWPASEKKIGKRHTHVLPGGPYAATGSKAAALRFCSARARCSDAFDRATGGKSPRPITPPLRASSVHGLGRDEKKRATLLIALEGGQPSSSSAMNNGRHLWMGWVG